MKEMRRYDRIQRGGMVAVTVAALLLIRISAFAQNWDRPDLLDFAEEFNAAGNNNAFMYMRQLYDTSIGSIFETQRAYGYHSAVNGNANANLYWYMFEPDKMTRKGKGAKLKQSDHLFLYVSFSTTGGSSASAYGMVAGCKGQMSAKDTEGPSNPDHAKWKIACDGDPLAALGLTPAQVTVVQSVLGPTVSINAKVP